MNKMIVLTGSLFIASTANADYAGLYGELYTNDTFDRPAGFDTTYRVYALFDSPLNQLVGIGGDVDEPVTAWTSTSFYHHELGGDTEHNAAFDPMFEGLHYDTYWTIGSTDSGTDGPTGEFWNTGPHWTANTFLGDDGGWSRVPTDPVTFGVFDGTYYRVLIGNFTLANPVDGLPELEISTKIAWLPDGGPTVVDYDSIYLPSPGALALLGLAGLVGRRRR